MSDDNTTATTTTFHITIPSGFKIFAREVAKPERVNRNIIAIVIHGGPGLSDHSESFPGLCQAPSLISSIHAMVFYDQLGCGESDKPRNPDLYSLENYVKELICVIDTVRSRHGDKQICLWGHSWGGQIVLELLLSSSSSSTFCSGGRCDELLLLPPSVQCAVVSNAPLDEKTYGRKQARLRLNLDDATRAFYEEEEKEIVLNSDSVGGLVYRKLIGISETNITGTMANWSALSLLKDERAVPPVPCLLVTGDDDTVPYEEYPMASSLAMANRPVEGAPFCRSVVLEGAGHGPFFGETSEMYFKCVGEFLDEVILVADHS
mmetsp:Transcript_9129/g.11252  ORF Transcript_9129/g.11252 Transcript_9129/m.11252 type:complete len:320 (-) Transcript_9129:148-1107(-)|eukprot:CAMPEP_0172517194 /NCGR_PEP_ID=MMETSP1066-20121228/282818_1 /TAXON_ID=671091 /ORGANISM="Coscinodiscus wailesii, Strain CCMP2513" /LENGTH=319 /DNA_ID=CAMNT_0013299059 /DNA_START=67 /DNA_END=1026 /DNA_ORIENTATION=+